MKKQYPKLFIDIRYFMSKDVITESTTEEAPSTSETEELPPSW